MGRCDLLLTRLRVPEFFFCAPAKLNSRLRRRLAATHMRAVALLAACFALACSGRGPWRAISREAETAADIISQREGGATSRTRTASGWPAP